MVTIHMLVGIPGSGKTTYAKKLTKELNIPVVSSDEIRNLNPDTKEEQIWPLIYKACIDYIKNGQDFIYDATNITPNTRKRFKERLLESVDNFQIGTYYFDTDPLVCQQRAIKRNTMAGERYMPPDVVLSYGSKVIAPSEEEGFIFRKVIKND